MFYGEGAGEKESVPSAALKREELEAGINILDLLVRSGLCSSKGEARRLVSQGGAYLDGQKVDSEEQATAIKSAMQNADVRAG